MDEIITKGFIFLKDDYNFIYKIAEIDYIEYESGEYEYLFYPYYNVIDLLSEKIFQGIPGLDLSLRLDCYERKNIVPVFISERTPSENREDLWELLAKYDMKSLNRLEWLIKTETQYFGDRLFVEAKKEEVNTIVVDSMYSLVERSDYIIKALLEVICLGKNLECSEIYINDNNRKDYYNLLMAIYKKDYDIKREKIKNGIEIAKENKKYKGRKPYDIDPLFFRIIVSEYREGNITLNDAIEKLNISKATFFRKIKKIQNKDMK